jgi:hypothetical protein
MRLCTVPIKSQSHGVHNRSARDVNSESNALDGTAALQVRA